MKLLRMFFTIAFLTTLLLCSSLSYGQPSTNWTFLTGGPVYSSPTFFNGAIYIGSDDSSFYCIDATTGAKKWSFKTQGIIRCKPAINEGNVYVASDDGNLYAINAASGMKIWNFNIGRKIKRFLPDLTSAPGEYWDYMQSSPFIDKGVVYVGSGDSCLYAVEAGSGELKWKTKTKGIIRSSPCVDDNMVYVGSFDGFIYAFNITDGSTVWSYDTHGSNYQHVQPSPKVSNGILYCGSRNPYFYALDSKTGKLIWKYSFGGSWVESSAAIVDSTVYVGSSDSKKVFAFDTKKGKLQWSYSSTGYPWSTPYYYNGTIYIGAAGFANSLTGLASGSILAINAANGKLLWKLDCGRSTFLGGIVSSPIVENNTVYYGSLDGKVYAVSTILTSTENTQGNNFIPDNYKLDNYPNPFNPETRIRFSVPENGKVSLMVFDSLGRRVAELVNKDMHAGIYEETFNADKLPSGVYFPVLRSGNIIKTSKIVCLK